MLPEPASSCWCSAAFEEDVSIKYLRESSLHLTALRENKGSALMQHGSTACFSIEQGAKMHRLLMPESSTLAARDRLQSLMQSESSTTRLIIGPPLIQPPLVNYLLLCFTHLSLCQQSKNLFKKVGLVSGDDLKAQQPRKMWDGLGVVQPSVTPAASRFHMAARVLPGVTLLLLFCSCYLFTETVR